MIYIAAHKKFNVPSLDGYIPLQVGAIDKIDLGYQKDSDGDNISIKNPNFCELTGLYWIWKNSKETTKGLVHYRRYFGSSNFSSSYDCIYSHSQMESLLVEADIVLPYIENFKQNAKEEIMVSCCTPEIFDRMRNVVKNVTPDYLTAFDNYFSGNKSSLFNMMFCRSEIFDAYCEWLFNVLFELEKNTDVSNLNKYQQRLYGFLSERLLNVWVKHNDLRVVNTPVINTEMGIAERLTLLRRRITNELCFRIKNI